MNSIQLFRFVIIACVLTTAAAWSESQYPYPADNEPLSAEQVAQQMYYTLRSMRVNNVVSDRKEGKSAMLINRAAGKRPNVNTFSMYTNNHFKDGITLSQQLAIFQSGKLKGTGILMSSFVDAAVSPNVQIWLPSLRKVRRFSAPLHDDPWSGSNLTFGEVFLRRVAHEKHELVDLPQVFGECLAVMVLDASEQTSRTRHLPDADCSHKDKQVYKLKSTALFKNWWYDNHVSYIDAKTFGVYRTVYFKNGKQIKTIDINWKSLNTNPRTLYPSYVYAKSEITGSETLLIVPGETISFNTDLRDSFWSERTLRKIKR